jgi:hypothetical protein
MSRRPPGTTSLRGTAMAAGDDQKVKCRPLLLWRLPERDNATWLGLRMAELPKDPPSTWLSFAVRNCTRADSVAPLA